MLLRTFTTVTSEENTLRSNFSVPPTLLTVVNVCNLSKKSSDDHVCLNASLSRISKMGLQKLLSNHTTRLGMMKLNVDVVFLKCIYGGYP